MGRARVTDKLIGSVMLLMTSLVLLVGLTFAWFTDSVTNEGNVIKTGTLKVSLQKDAVNDGDVDSWTDVTESEPVFNDLTFEPGKSDAVNLQAVNNGDLAAKYELRFANVKATEGVDSVLEVSLDGKSLGTLSSMVDNGTPIATGQVDAKSQTDAVSKIGQLTIKMPENLDNTYQDAQVTFDLAFVATQAAKEQDGFGNDQYDASATMPKLVSTPEELVAAAEKGGTVVLESDITSTDNIVFNADASLDMNGKTLDLNNGSGKIEVAKGSSLTISGAGTVNGRLYADRNAVLTVNAGEAFSVKSTASNTVYAGLNAVVSINGGTYTTAVEEDAVHILGSKLIMSNATVVVEAKTVMNAKGIHSNASYTELNNVIVQGNYSTALNLNNGNGRAVVRGGAFVTDKESDPDFGAPTISYKGTLDISGASITRIRNGIEYSRPGASSVEGLTYSNLTFSAVEGAGGGDIDYKH